jgi:DNA-nicking Smr family endonuclease
MSPSRKIVRDADVFAAAMRDVKPLRQTKLAPPPSQNTAAAAVPRAPRAPRTAPPPSVAPNPGIDRRTAQRLRKGAMEIDRRLDLHGMTEAAAHAALDRFVEQAWRQGARMLLVITGKGGAGRGEGVLKRNLPRWLAIGDNAACVLRIEQAQPKHGGSGAYYVLLRRRREA